MEMIPVRRIGLGTKRYTEVHRPMAERIIDNLVLGAFSVLYSAAVLVLRLLRRG